MNRDAWVTRREAAFLTGVTPDAIGKWHDRGWLAADKKTRRRLRVKMAPNGRLWYRLGDILDAERDTFLSGKSRRRTPRPVDTDAA